MLEIKVAGKEDILEIEKILKEHNMDLDKEGDLISNCMIAYDDKIPVAAAGYIHINNIAILKYTAVKNNRQREYIGEGIVKATLNVMDKNGINKVFVIIDKNDLFFKKIGFKEVSVDRLEKETQNILLINMSDGKIVLQVLLPDYFQRACRSKI